MAQSGTAGANVSRGLDPNGIDRAIAVTEDGEVKIVGGGGGGGGLTDAELRAMPVPISGTVDTGLSQPLTDAQLRATPVPVSVFGTLTTDGSGSTQPVSAVALPLPSGASTSANQATGNGSLSSIDSKVLTDAQLRATPVPVSGTVTADIGNLNGVATAANQTTANASLSSIDGKNPALVSGRVPVDGSGVTQPMSVASLPLPSGAATAALQPTLISGASQTYSYISSPSQVAYDLVAKATPFGELAVTPASIPLFYDQFDTALDTTNRWTASGTSTPVTSSGSIVLGLAASNAVSSVVISQPTFSPPFGPYLIAGKLTFGAQQTNPNAHRFFGMGVVTSYAAATPLTNGFGFEVDLTGELNAVVYISGTRYVVNSTNAALITAPGGWATNMVMSTYGQTMTWPASGTVTVVMRYVNGAVYFYSNVGSNITFDVPLGIASYSPAVTVLNIRAAAITTPAVSTVLATTYTGSGFVLGGSIGNIINDPLFPWRGVTVKAPSTAAVATDLPMVVALHPSTVPAVTVSSTTALTPGVATGNLGKAEDAVAASGDTGVAVWSVRRDVAAISTSLAGDYNAFTTDQFGALYVCNLGTKKRSYSCAFQIVPAASASDVVEIVGSATTTVEIASITIGGVQTTAGQVLTNLLRRSTAATGGTSTNEAIVPHQSTDAAATAVIKGYTVNPTTGTLVGNIRSRRLPIGQAASLSDVAIFEFGKNSKPIFLSGVAQTLCINLAGATIIGGTLDIEIEFTEV